MGFKLFNHGSRWLKADFHLHTRADKEFTYSGEENDYLNQYVKALSDAGIRLGVITNHNKFDLEEFKNLRKKALKNEIYLLPGLELSVNDGQSGIHTLVVFSDIWFKNKEQTNYIKKFLEKTFAETANFENENARSSHNIEDTIKTLDGYERDYFLIFAHVEASNGLWGGMSIGRIQELFQKDIVRHRVLGFQKVSTIDKRQKVQTALGLAYPAEVEGSDAKCLTDIGNRKSSFLKVGDFSFDAIKFALRDQMSRLKPTTPKYQHSYIKKIAFEGAGVLGGKEISLSPELNTFIGIRGSGKSSVLEGIRYALDIPLGEIASDKTYKDGLVENLLRSGGKIIIDAVDRHGQDYQIHRIYNESSDVFVNETLQPGISICDTVLYQPIYFGQKDLSNTGAGFENDLIEKLIGEELNPLRQKIALQQQCVIDAINQIKRIDLTAQQKDDWMRKKQDTKFKLQFYQNHGIESKLETQVEFDRDERKLQEMFDSTDRFVSELRKLITRHEEELRNQTTYNSKSNQPFFEDFYLCFDGILSSFKELKSISDKNQGVLDQLQEKLQKFKNQKQDLKEKFAVIDQKLAAELKQAGVRAINPQEYRRLKGLLEESNKQLSYLDKNERLLAQANTALARQLDKLNQLWLEEYRKIESILEKINNASSHLTITPRFKGNKLAMLNRIQELFRGSRIRETTLKGIVDDYSDFGAIWKNHDAIKSKLDSSFETFWNFFDPNLDKLLTWQIPNSFAIEYRGKPLEEHSLGQRASALMLFILNQQDNDVVIIDQPEDDLDNQTIYEDVIKLIRKLKPKTQFVFATHNANIPVLGDAEQVLACSYEEDSIQIETGSIDCKLVQNRIVDIMEGGVEAFERRKHVYETWKPQNDITHH